MSKYEIGDIVRIREWDDMAEEYGVVGSVIQVTHSFTKDMKCLCGKSATIRTKNPGNDMYFLFSEEFPEFDEYVFSEKMFVPDEENDVEVSEELLNYLNAMKGVKT